MAEFSNKQMDWKVRRRHFVDHGHEREAITGSYCPDWDESNCPSSMH
ncbi:hypothetical protein RISK_006338 [Rhodopirellula islandica]|uniref:Uncharacterized protein n=1 Tax=Rhodopirellula islandica TaxID=595434 RepID=A0A0J1B4E6_RHOIS|nr:hypothetical protein RISK_006338 [Rhodopirellula islandica]